MAAEGELRSHIDDSEKVRELQEKLGDMKAEVSSAFLVFVFYRYKKFIFNIHSLSVFFSRCGFLWVQLLHRGLKAITLERVIQN